MRGFKVGDIVKMSAAGKARYRDAPYNPHKGVGRVFDNDSYRRGGQCYRVEWPEGITNCYSADELQVTTRMEENE